MKRKYFFMAMPVVAILLVAILLANGGTISGAKDASGKQDKKNSSELVVHEWGTFTTLAGSDGGLLNGLYLDEEPLPDFVFQYQTVPATINQRGKGVAFEPTHVNVKMETPVLYFYSPHSLHASVRVDFPRGLISQWYPTCSGGNEPPAGNTPSGGGRKVMAVDFATPVNGFMKWEPDVLAPGTRQTISHPGGSPTWNTPRQTDANLLSIKNGSREDVEKFIFYRGIANFTPPVRARFAGAASSSASESAPIEISNMGKQDLPFVLVYEKKEKGDAIIYWQGGVKAGEKRLVDHREGQVADFAEFEKALITAGLYPKEAKALLATWKNSYFGTKGIRLFWIAPEEWVNTILPLHISPQPRETKRVFVGRYELLSPAFETSLLQGWQKNGGLLPDGKEVASDRYHLAYEDLVQRRAGR